MNKIIKTIAPFALAAVLSNSYAGKPAEPKPTPAPGKQVFVEEKQQAPIIYDTPDNDFKLRLGVSGKKVKRQFGGITTIPCPDDFSESLKDTLYGVDASLQRKIVSSRNGRFSLWLGPMAGYGAQNTSVTGPSTGINADGKATIDSNLYKLELGARLSADYSLVQSPRVGTLDLTAGAELFGAYAKDDISARGTASNQYGDDITGRFSGSDSALGWGARGTLGLEYTHPRLFGGNAGVYAEGSYGYNDLDFTIKGKTDVKINGSSGRSDATLKESFSEDFGLRTGLRFTW